MKRMKKLLTGLTLFFLAADVGNDIVDDDNDGICGWTFRKNADD